MSSAPFHMAFPVTDLEATRRFYAGVLGCRVGREAERWIDFEFFGHQISAHLIDAPESGVPTNVVDGKDIPVRHFGAILEWGRWHELADRLRSSGVTFLVEPHVRFVGEPGEQATLFVKDPNGNALEFKSFRDMGQIFAT